MSEFLFFRSGRLRGTKSFAFRVLTMPNKKLCIQGCPDDCPRAYFSASRRHLVDMWTFQCKFSLYSQYLDIGMNAAPLSARMGDGVPGHNSVQ
jgi:hypothetical protein